MLGSSDRGRGKEVRKGQPPTFQALKLSGVTAVPQALSAASRASSAAYRAARSLAASLALGPFCWAILPARAQV